MKFCFWKFTSKINPVTPKAFTGHPFTSMYRSSEKLKKKSIVGKKFEIVVELGVLGKKIEKNEFRLFAVDTFCQIYLFLTFRDMNLAPLRRVSNLVKNCVQ